ncbi:MAG TPA: hypothetical protein VI727_10095 [Candidatus Brocadiaceae bacterium]|nr:hypothetical protein [Candidatus Brocadiaceae bacterium]
MITKNDIEKPRSPRGLRQFVTYRKRKIRAITTERHNAMRHKGLYNVFIKEIVPLSVFALKAYPNSYRVQPILGNQGYDAIVRDMEGNIIDFVELTFPDDWEAKAKDANLIVSRGYGKCDVFSPGEDIERLSKFIQHVCSKKTKKDYSDCTLVIVINFLPVSKQFRKLYSRKLQQVLTNVQSTSFTAKRVFLLLLEQHKILKVKE